MVSTQPMSLQSALTYSLDRVQDNCHVFGAGFPTMGYPEYKITPNNNWVTSFWPGMLWLAYNSTENVELRAKAEALHASFGERLDKRVRLTHDLGFIYLLSCRAQWMLTGNAAAYETALRAAKELARRFNPRGNFIQAWGEVGEEPEAGRMIVDCMMNLNLLYWAGEQTGDDTYREMARSHAASTQKYIVRDDGSTYHTFFFDSQTGEPLDGKTHQGYADESLWSRGQAWAIYGFALSAQWLDDAGFLAVARKVADRFLTDSPPDKTPLWDVRLPPHAPQNLDSSAGAIAACGLLRLAKLTGYKQYRQKAETLLQSLVDECLDTVPGSQGLLKHGAQRVLANETPDGYLIYGDYYFLEALLTLNGQAPDFWGPSGS